jgi:hypothetical protein
MKRIDAAKNLGIKSLQKVEQTSPRKARPRRALFPIIMIVFCVAIALALTEAGLRVLGFNPRRAASPRLGPSISMPDAKLGWVNRPGTYLSPEAGKAAMTFLVDHSRRSWEAPAKTAQRGEVLVVGCSFTQGFGIADEDTFSYLLNQRYPHLMFHNFGTGGYGTYQSLLRIEQNLSRANTDEIPLVIYGFIDLHLQRNVAVANWVRSLAARRTQYVVPPHVRAGKNGLEYYGPDSISFWPLESRSALVALLANAYLELRLRNQGSQLPATTKLIEQMNSLVVARRKRFLIVILNRPPKGLVPFLENKAISYVNCDNPAFDKMSSEYHLGGIGHPNAAQNVLWAACIGRWIDAEMPELARP